jgi:hypothetical protein
MSASAACASAPGPLGERELSRDGFSLAKRVLRTDSPAGFAQRAGGVGAREQENRGRGRTGGNGKDAILAWQ